MKLIELSTVAIAILTSGLAHADEPTPARKQAIRDAQQAGILSGAPSKEITNMISVMSGTWTCEGSDIVPDESARDRDARKLTGTLTATSELEGNWMHWSYATTSQGPSAITSEEDITFDPTSKLWRRILRRGAWAGAETSAVGSELVFTRGDLFGGAADKWMVRDHLEGAGTELRLWVDTSKDGTKWTPIQDLRCKKRK